jgi:hypothetical protein
MSHIPAALRRAVYDRADGACEYCLFPGWATPTARVSAIDFKTVVAVIPARRAF